MLKSINNAIKSTINIPTRTFNQVDYRIKPNDKLNSALYLRINSSQRGIMMAPLGRSIIDEKGVKVFKSWIESL